MVCVTFRPRDNHHDSAGRWRSTKWGASVGLCATGRRDHGALLPCCQRHRVPGRDVLRVLVLAIVCWVGLLAMAPPSVASVTCPAVTAGNHGLINFDAGTCTVGTGELNLSNQPVDSICYGNCAGVAGFYAIWSGGTGGALAPRARSLRPIFRLVEPTWPLMTSKWPGMTSRCWTILQ